MPRTAEKLDDAPSTGAVQRRVEEAKARQLAEREAQKKEVQISLACARDGLVVSELARKHGWDYGYTRGLLWDLAEENKLHERRERWWHGPGSEPFVRPSEAPRLSPPKPAPSSSLEPPGPLPARGARPLPGVAPKTVKLGARPSKPTTEEEARQMGPSSPEASVVEESSTVESDPRSSLDSGTAAERKLLVERQGGEASPELVREADPVPLPQAEEESAAPTSPLTMLHPEPAKLAGPTHAIGLVPEDLEPGSSAEVEVVTDEDLETVLVPSGDASSGEGSSEPDVSQGTAGPGPSPAEERAAGEGADLVQVEPVIAPAAEAGVSGGVESAPADPAAIYPSQGAPKAPPAEEHGSADGTPGLVGGLATPSRGDGRLVDPPAPVPAVESGGAGGPETEEAPVQPAPTSEPLTRQGLTLEQVVEAVVQAGRPLTSSETARLVYGPTPTGRQLWRVQQFLREATELERLSRTGGQYHAGELGAELPTMRQQIVEIVCKHPQGITLASVCELLYGEPIETRGAGYARVQGALRRALQTRQVSMHLNGKRTLWAPPGVTIDLQRGPSPRALWCRARREELGLTQRQLGEAAGLPSPQSCVSSLERGERDESVHWEAIERVLGPYPGPEAFAQQPPESREIPAEQGPPPPTLPPVNDEWSSEGRGPSLRQLLLAAAAELEEAEEAESKALGLLEENAELQRKVAELQQRWVQTETERMRLQARVHELEHQVEGLELQAARAVELEARCAAAEGECQRTRGRPSAALQVLEVDGG
jgi:transcriptional regulator with XRE-family HTH domain